MSSSTTSLSPVKQALLALEEMRAKVERLESARTEPIAVIGLACRFPGGADSEGFWQTLEQGKDAVGEIPSSRWNADDYYNPDPDAAGKMATRWGGFLDQVDRFEPEFFGISPREALRMDPQQRLLLEVAWEALENAGQSPAKLMSSPTGVFVGVTGDEYAQMFHKAGEKNRFDMYFASGVARSVATGRISYVLGIQGPNLSLDTACSSSLVAVHTACLHLRAGECRTALAGGVNVILSPEITMAFSRGHMMAADGRCKAFDSRADGFVRGEGCGVVVLKRLSDAVADGDNVLAVIRGSAVNQDGRSSGLTVPNGPAQEAVIRQALANAGVKPEEVDFVEAHGTGTSLGDPIEAHALASVLGEGRSKDRPLVIGSVKTNIGHLEAAAGVAGLIKVVLSLQKEKIPANLHFERMNPHIDWKGLEVEVPTQGRQWKRSEGKKRLAGVSSFGFSGTNAHVVLEEAPVVERKEGSNARGVHVLALSARTDSALNELARRYAAGLNGNIEDVCFTATAGRAGLAERAVYVASSADDLREQLQNEQALVRGVSGSRDRQRVAFLFSGQGAQYAGMGRELYENEPVFRKAIDACNAADLLYGSTAEALDDTRNTQPALFAIEYALAELWKSWGVEPSMVLGHSVGEYAAACVAGLYTPAEGMALIRERARLMGELPYGEGAMAAIFAGEDAVQAAVARLRQWVFVAAVNGPEHVVISGRAAEVESICQEFADKGVRVERLRVSHAFHSPLMEPIEEAFERYAAQVQARAPRVTLISSVTGRPVTAKDLTGSYWRKQIRQTVRFQDALAWAGAQGCDVFVEIGPGSTLLGMGKAGIGREGQAWLPSLRRSKQDARQLTETLGALWARGVDVNWEAYYADRGCRRVPLPVYPFERERYWIDDLGSKQKRARGGHPLLGERTDLADGTSLWQSELSLENQPWISGHVVHDLTILPMTAYLEMMGSAAAQLGHGESGIEDVIIREPLVLREGGEIAVQTIAKGGTIEIHSRSGNAWKLHASGRLGNAERIEPAMAIHAVRDRLKPADEGAFYDDLAARGHAFGDAFRLVREIFSGTDEALARVEVPASSGFLIHPAVLDACVQAIAAALGASSQNSYLPVGVSRFAFRPVSGPVLWSHATLKPSAGGEVLEATVRVVDGDGSEIAVLSGLELRRASAQSLARMTGETAADVLFAPSWEVAEEPLSRIAKEVRSLSTAAVIDSGMDRYPAIRHAMDQLCSHTIADALAKLGYKLAPGVRFSLDDLNVDAKHRMLAERLLDILAEDGVLHRSGEQWECRIAPAGEVLGWDEMREQFPEFEAEIDITARCASQLATVLIGATDALQVLFPEGSTAPAERLYSESPSARTFNSLVAEAVERTVAPRTGRIRVLEVGCGTGGTTTFVLPRLPHERSTYTFTDISPLFTTRAKERFAAFPFIEYRTLDLEHVPSDFARGSYDLIIAANVVHATADVKRTLTSLHELLAPEGVLVMLEVTRPERWIDLTFGMTEGWWRFTDRDLRPSYALLSGEQWMELLPAVGFTACEAITAGEDSLNTILLARRGEGTRELQGRWFVDGAGAFAADIPAALRGRGATVVQDASEADRIIYAATPGVSDQRAICEPLLKLLNVTKAARLYLVTAGAQLDVVNPAAATLWGVGRTIPAERSEMQCVCIDLDPSDLRVESLLHEITINDGETEVAWRGGVRYVNRLRHCQFDDERLRLSVDRRGSIDNLAMAVATRRTPGPGQVEIEVAAAGLGFRDVLNVLGMYPGDPGPLGAECGGRIVSVGAGVEQFVVGDEVIAIAPGAHDGYVLADAELVAHRPSGLSIEEATTLPVPYLTAVYTLEYLGKIRKGDRVLIHAAAGGVGLAAVHVARRAGAEIYATAGSEEKRNLLRSLGVEHVFDSRSASFAESIAGVDIVLNSLTGDAMDASFRILAPGGRFLEMGKSGLRTEEQLRALGKDIRYFVVDWSEELRGNAALIGSMLRRIAVDAGSGVLPALPHTVFPFSDAAEAYRFMAQARHTGRIILRQPATVAIRADRTYLIAGGTGGLGLAAAEWLVAQGARSLLLIGRREPSGKAAASIAKLKEAGARVQLGRADIGDRNQLEDVLREARATMPPIAGVVNSAGSLDAAMLSEQDWARFDRVFGAKVAGAENLHLLTAGEPLDFFVLYSSVASLLGAPGQANHAAANAFEDAFAHALRACGVPAISIDWGAWKGAGSADRKELEQRREAIGLHTFSVPEGIEWFRRILNAAPVQIAAARMDWARYAARGSVSQTVRTMAPVEAVQTSKSANKPQLTAAKPSAPALLEELEAAPAAGKRRVIETFVRDVAVRVLGLPAGRKIDTRQPLNELGLDSLMAVEFRNALSTSTGRSLPVTLLFSYPAISDITQYLEGELLGTPEEEQPMAAAVAAAADSSHVLAAVEELSDEEVDRLLAAKLGGR